MDSAKKTLLPSLQVRVAFIKISLDVIDKGSKADVVAGKKIVNCEGRVGVDIINRNRQKKKVN